MSRFRQGMLIGLILSVLMALAIALSASEERRRQLRHRFEELRNTLPSREQMKHAVQETATRAQETGSHLGEQMQESTDKLAHRTQEILTSAHQKVTSLGDK